MSAMMQKVSTFLNHHFPIWQQNPEFCLAVLFLMVCTGIYWFCYRSKPAAVILCTQMLYFVPFIRI